MVGDRNEREGRRAAARALAKGVSASPVFSDFSRFVKKALMKAIPQQVQS
jgi:hypothetical protein